MRYKWLGLAAFLVLVFWVPVYWTPENCCGHPYYEGWTIAKHFILGHESCAVFYYGAWGIIHAWLPLVLFVTIMTSLLYSLGDGGDG